MLPGYDGISYLLTAVAKNILKQHNFSSNDLFTISRNKKIKSVDLCEN